MIGPARQLRRAGSCLRHRAGPFGYASLPDNRGYQDPALAPPPSSAPPGLYISFLCKLAAGLRWSLGRGLVLVSGSSTPLLLVPRGLEGRLPVGGMGRVGTAVGFLPCQSWLRGASYPARCARSNPPPAQLWPLC